MGSLVGFSIGGWGEAGKEEGQRKHPTARVLAKVLQTSVVPIKSNMRSDVTTTKE